jgi:hypothetical protein
LVFESGHEGAGGTRLEKTRTGHKVRKPKRASGAALTGYFTPAVGDNVRSPVILLTGARTPYVVLYNLEVRDASAWPDSSSEAYFKGP